MFHIMYFTVVVGSYGGCHMLIMLFVSSISNSMQMPVLTPCGGRIRRVMRRIRGGVFFRLGISDIREHGAHHHGCSKVPMVGIQNKVHPTNLQTRPRKESEKSSTLCLNNSNTYILTDGD